MRRATRTRNGSSASSRRPGGRRPTDRRATATRTRPARGGRPASSGLLFGGLAVAAVIVLALGIVLLNGGSDSRASAEPTAESAKPSVPTEGEMNEARSLYKEARQLASRADRASSDGNQAEATRLRREGLDKVERAIAIWNDMMSRISEDEQKKFLKYEDTEVRHWNLLKRRLWTPDVTH